MFIIEGDGELNYSAIDDISLLWMKDDGDEKAFAELVKRHPDIYNPREIQRFLEDVFKFRADQRRNALGQFAPEGVGSGDKDVAAGYKPSDYSDLKDFSVKLGDYSDLAMAIERYTRYGFLEINNYLRYPREQKSPHTEKDIDALQKLCLSQSLPEPMSFKRVQEKFDGFKLQNKIIGGRVEAALVKVDENGQEQIKTLDSLVDSKWVSDGFLSTSTEMYNGQPTKVGYGEDLYFKLHILAPQGMRGAAINEGEYEFLIPHGSEFTIKKTDLIDNKAHIWLEASNNVK